MAIAVHIADFKQLQLLVSFLGMLLWICSVLTFNALAVIAKFVTAVEIAT